MVPRTCESAVMLNGEISGRSQVLKMSPSMVVSPVTHIRPRLAMAYSSTSAFFLMLQFIAIFLEIWFLMPVQVMVILWPLYSDSPA